MTDAAAGNAPRSSPPFAPFAAAVRTAQGRASSRGFLRGALISDPFDTTDDDYASQPDRSAHPPR
jgi:hypothetical protein